MPVPLLYCKIQDSMIKYNKAHIYKAQYKKEIDYEGFTYKRKST